MEFKEKVNSLQGKMVSAGDTKLYNSLGSLIKDYRLWHKMSQEILAEKLGVSTRELRNWEVDRHRVRIDNLHDISEITGIPMQVCVALNADQPVWYSVRKRRLAYSSIEGELFSFQEYFRHRQKFEDEFPIKNEPITKDKHISMILSFHHEILDKERPLGKDVIKTASMILPDLNRIFFDGWGHYVGHQVCLPIRKDLYEQIKKQENFEGYLTTERMCDILALHEGVFFIYSIFAANVSVGYLLNIINVRFLDKIDRVEQKERYLYAVHTATTEGMEFLKNLGMRVVREHEYLRNEVSPKIFEIEIDVLMNPLGPYGILRWMLGGNDRGGGGGSFTRDAKWKIPDGGPLTVGGPLSVGSEECNDPKRVRLCNLVIGSCPNPKCNLYGETGKSNIISNGTYRTKDGILYRRFFCKECGESFCSRAGSIFYGLRSPQEKVLTALKLLIKGMSLRGAAKVLEVKRHTIRHWLKSATEQSGKIDAMLMGELGVTQAELETLWSSVKENSLRQRAILWRASNTSHGTDLKPEGISDQ